MTSQNNSSDNDDKFKPGDTEVPPPGTDPIGKPASIPPPPMFLDDDEAFVHGETATARGWAFKHPWLSSHSPEVLRVTNTGEAELRIAPKAYSGSPYGTFNGGLIVTGCLATAQMAGTHRFGERVSVMTADATFVSPSMLDLDAMFRAKVIHFLSKSRALVHVIWYQLDSEGQMQDKGSMTVILAKARKADLDPTATNIDQGLLMVDNSPHTIQCQPLVNENPYFSRMGVTVTHLSKEIGVQAHLLPQQRNLNTQGIVADGVLYAFGDALVCYATVPWLGEKPTTSQLKFERIAQMPADAVIFGEAKVDVDMGKRAKVHGLAYYLNHAGDRVIVGLYEAMIVGT